MSLLTQEKWGDEKKKCFFGEDGEMNQCGGPGRALPSLKWFGGGQGSFPSEVLCVPGGSGMLVSLWLSHWRNWDDFELSP